MLRSSMVYSVKECKQRADLREAIDRDPKLMLKLTDDEIRELFSHTYLEELVEAPDYVRSDWIPGAGW